MRQRSGRSAPRDFVHPHLPRRLALAVLAFAGAVSAAERRVVVADPQPPLAGATATGPLTGYLDRAAGADPFPPSRDPFLPRPAADRAAFGATLTGWGYVALSSTISRRAV